MNREDRERLEKRNRVIRFIMLFVAIIALLVVVVYHFFIEDNYNNNISNIKFPSGAIKENTVRDNLEEIIK